MIKQNRQHYNQTKAILLAVQVILSQISGAISIGGNNQTLTLADDLNRLVRTSDNIDLLIVDSKGIGASLVSLTHRHHGSSGELTKVTQVVQILLGRGGCQRHGVCISINNLSQAGLSANNSGRRASRSLDMSISFSSMI